jgi:hypothetical protein
MSATPNFIAPQQNWALVENRLREEDAIWLRSLTMHERFTLYSDLVKTLRNARNQIPSDWERLEKRNWEEKLAIRRRLTEALSKLDQWRSERSAANHAG